MGDPPRALVGPPGLWVWIIAFGLVMATAIVGFFLSDWANQKADQAALKSLEAQVGILDQLPPPAAREGRVVVIIGTSLTGAALQSAGAPLDKYPASMKLVVLVGNNLKPGWFEGLVPALHRARPDLILLEPRLLSAIGGPAELPGRVQNLLHALLPQARSKGAPPACHGVIRRQSPKAGGRAGFISGCSIPSGFASIGCRCWRGCAPMELKLASLICRARTNWKRRRQICCDGVSPWRNAWPTKASSSGIHPETGQRSIFATWRISITRAQSSSTTGSRPN